MDNVELTKGIGLARRTMLNRQRASDQLGRRCQSNKVHTKSCMNNVKLTKFIQLQLQLTDPDTSESVQVSFYFSLRFQLFAVLQ